MRVGSLQQYLDKFYISRAELAVRLKISDCEIEPLIRCGIIPSWSYKVEDSVSFTHVFGESTAVDCKDGEYFSPAVLDWFTSNSAKFSERVKYANLLEHIHLDFIQRYTALAMQNGRFLDTFHFSVKDTESIGEMAENTWQHHLKGTYGICVKQPSSIDHIIEKQIAAAALSEFTNNGEKDRYTENEIDRLHSLITNFDQIVMPFSPVDYPKSSRKRLVDDVLSKLKTVEH